MSGAEWGAEQVIDARLAEKRFARPALTVDQHDVEEREADRRAAAHAQALIERDRATYEAWKPALAVMSIHPPTLAILEEALQLLTKQTERLVPSSDAVYHLQEAHLAVKADVQHAEAAQ